MLQELRQKNPDIPFYDVYMAEFREYGRVIEHLDVRELCAAAADIETPDAGSVYRPKVEAFERLPVAAEIRDQLFGTLPTQLGYCYGHNNYLNAVEWHASSEINIAVTPLVVLLAKRSDLQGKELSAAKIKAFYVPRGTVLETYATTLHFCPCEVQSSGFGWVVALPEGSNTPLGSAGPDPLLMKRNKWVIAHRDNAALIQNGAVSGIYGKNLNIEY